MTETSDTPIQSHPGKRGIIVIVVLAAIFFTLLILLLRAGGDQSLSTGPRNQDLYVLPRSLRIRTQPNAQASPIATAVRGEKLRLVEDRGAWVKVRNPAGLMGWADRSGLEGSAEHDRRRARYIAIRRLPVLEGIVEERVPLYAGPGIFYSIVGELTPENRVRVYTRDHDFYAVEVGEDIAYAEVDAINLSASGAPQVDVAAVTRPTFEEEEEGEVAELPPLEAPIEMPPREPEPIFEPPAVESRVYPAVPPGGTQPEVVDRVMPAYPSAARKSGVAGRVVLRAIIRRDGTVDNVQILRDLPEGLGEAAARAVARWRFRPASYRGEPIDVYYTVTVNFRLD
jgi:TonB family protein